MADEETEVIEVTVDIAELRKMKVPELKKKLAELGLPTKGPKAELLARVEKYISEQEEEEEDLLEDELGEGGEGGEDGEGGEEEEVPEGEQSTKQETANGKESATDQPSEVETKPAPPPQQTNTQSDTTVTKLSAQERAELRAKRFGSNTSNTAKKAARAERFGASSYDGLGKKTPTADEAERMRKRAGRFGGTVAPALVQLDDLDKKKQRLGRFGTAVADLAVDEKKKLRADRFGTS